MIENWFEAAIIAVIIAGIAVAVWRGGQSNPEGTGSLGRKVTRLDGTVQSLVAETQDIDRRVGEIERTAAKTSDIKRLERQLAQHNSDLAAVREMVAGMAKAAELRGAQLDRLYNFIVEKGMK